MVEMVNVENHSRTAGKAEGTTVDMSAETKSQVGTRRPRPRLLLAWLGQTVAGLSWAVSVLLYEAEAGETWSHADRLQMTAACAWLASNFLALPDIFES